MIQKLTKSTTFEIYQSASREGDRGAVEQVVMTQGLCDSRSDDEVGRTLQAVSNLINRYEVLSGLLEGVFRGLIWGLTRLNGQASPEFLAQDSTLDDFLGQVRTRLEPAANQFRVCLESFERDSLANKRGSVEIDRMHKLLEDSATAMRGNNDCVTAVMDRHLRVQKEKHKGVWIEVDKYWTLMPGFGDTSDEPQLLLRAVENGGAGGVLRRLNSGAHNCSSASLEKMVISPSLLQRRRGTQECTPIWNSGPKFVAWC